jgi:tRNA 2-thiouridine synthesizing protein A
LKASLTYCANATIAKSSAQSFDSPDEQKYEGKAMTISSREPFSLILDTRGLMCPMPVLKTKKALRDVPPGGVIKVMATDPGSVADMKSFCEMTGNVLLASLQEDDVFVYHIEHRGK